jgi:5-formyltetrahydrofolate cyclo-ligase
VNEPPRIAKARLRAQFGERGRAFSPAERAEASARICERLKQQPVWPEARSVFFFAPLPEEADIGPLLSEALRLGKRIALPRYSKSDDCYLPHRVADLERDLQPGYFGIREPSRACPAFALDQLDLTLVPGVGFGLNGGRLGRGKGYYDRLLARISGWKCGVAFDWQVVPEIHMEPHDVCVDYIVTPARWHEVPPRPRPSS